MKHILKINEALGLIEVTLKSQRNPSLIITIIKGRDNRIKEIHNPKNVNFPFSVGQLLQRNIETWASNNNYLIDGKDFSPEKKIFGIKTSDIPPGHELRMLYPGKFKK